MFSAHLASLDEHLREIEACLIFMTRSARFQTYAGKWLAWQSIDPAERDFIDKFMKMRGFRNEILCGALFVSAYAGYEQFVADIVVSAVDKVGEASGCFLNLPESWRKQNIYRSGQALETVMQPRQAYPFNYEDMARNLGTCHSGSSAVRLNSSAFIIYKGCLDASTLTEFLRRIGVSLKWDHIAKQEDVKKAFPDTAGARDRAKAAQEFLDRMATRRNRIAHSPAVASDVTEQIVYEQVRFIRALCRALATTVKEQVQLVVGKMKSRH